jgi:F0F1-type ATP synthase membrane subunit b/b'
MVLVLNRTLLKPINRILDYRERGTKGRFTDAQGILATVTERLREYEFGLRTARAEGYALLERGRDTVSGERERKLGEIKEELSRWLHEEKEKLRMDAEEIKATLQKDAQTMAVEIGRQILHREIRIDRPSR